MSLFSELLSKSADLETQKKLALLKEGAMKQKFQNAVDVGTDAFWGAVAKIFSDIKSGDFDPAEDDAFNTAAERAIMTWYETNSGVTEGQSVAVKKKFTDHAFSTWLSNHYFDDEVIDEWNELLIGVTESNEWVGLCDAFLKQHKIPFSCVDAKPDGGAVKWTMVERK